VTGEQLRVVEAALAPASGRRRRQVTTAGTGEGTSGIIVAASQAVTGGLAGTSPERRAHAPLLVLERREPRIDTDGGATPGAGRNPSARTTHRLGGRATPGHVNGNTRATNEVTTRRRYSPLRQ